MRDLKYHSVITIARYKPLVKWKFMLLTFSTILVFLCLIVTAEAAAFPQLEDTNDLLKTEESLSISALAHEPPRFGFNSFAVRYDGSFAVAQEVFSAEREKTVVVYDGDGEFSYAISFSAPGAYGVDFDGDALRIWLVRSDCAVTVDEHGHVIRVQLAQDANAFDTYWNENLCAKEYILGNAVYCSENTGWFARTFALDYGQLALTQYGNAHVLYQAEYRPVFPTYGSFFAVLIIPIAIATMVLVIKYKQKQKQ